MRTRRRLRRYSNNGSVNLGFQIAPMIDVVFVILLFFMVKAGDLQIEKSHNTRLPGGREGLSMPDEVAITIADDGQVALNDDPLDSPEATELKQLAHSLKALKEASDSSQSQLLITVIADETARYQRVVDVMDALSQAKISNVTFAANTAE